MMMMTMMKMKMMQMKSTVSDICNEIPAMLVIKSGSSGRISPRVNVMYGVKDTTLMVGLETCLKGEFMQLTKFVGRGRTMLPQL